MSDKHLLALMERLKQVRADLDVADETPFGEVGKLLDRMALRVDEAVALVRSLQGEPLDRADTAHVVAALREEAA
jgi:hypothetical protein